MKLYEAQLRYTVKRSRPIVHLNRADLIAGYMKRVFFSYPMCEAAFVICVNRRNHLLCHTLLSTGTVHATLIAPREVMRAAVLATASAIVISHNHPSGDPSPSAPDIEVTRLVREAARTLQIPLLDHVIVGTKEADPVGRGFYSFREAGLL